MSPVPTERDIETLFSPVVDEFEKTFGWRILADGKALEECVIRAEETLGQINGVDDPNRYKIAGHYAFWIRKLKPFQLYNEEEMTAMFNGLGKSGKDIAAFLPKFPIPKGARTRFVNELIAVFFACGLVRNYSLVGTQLKLSAPLLNDWVVGLRYHSYSPSSLAILLEGLAQGSAPKGTSVR